MKTMIISVFTGCGKTWLANNQEQYGYKICDSDSSKYEKQNGWEIKYVNNIIKQAKTGRYDFIFVCQTKSVIEELDRKKVPYTIVEPDNIVWGEHETAERTIQRQLIKQQWFGRLLLRP